MGRPPRLRRLDPRVGQLFDLICSQTYTSQTLVGLKYHAACMPLEDLNAENIEAAFVVIKVLDKLAYQVRPSTDRIELESRLYASLIPRLLSFTIPASEAVAFRLINNRPAMIQELQFLETLRQMKRCIADCARMRRSVASPRAAHDRVLGSLGLSTLEPVQMETEEYRSILRYCIDRGSIEHDHLQYAVRGIFRLERVDEEKRCTPQSSSGKLTTRHDDCRLLWHGASISTVPDIVTRGLCIPPAGALHLGWTWGRGVYLSSMSAMALRSCNASWTDGHAALMLCETQLGDSLVVDAGDEAQQSHRRPPEGHREGKHSTYARGTISLPEFVDAGKELGRPELCGIKMPYGSVTIRGNENDIRHCDDKTHPLYDEHVVYGESQVRLRYLVLLKVNV